MAPCWIGEKKLAGADGGSLVGEISGKAVKSGLPSELECPEGDSDVRVVHETLCSPRRTGPDILEYGFSH